MWMRRFREVGRGPKNPRPRTFRTALVGLRCFVLRILLLGEIVGKAGIYCIKDGLKDLKDSTKADFVVANGDGATGGFGIGKNHSVYLRKLGLDVITGGDQIYFKKDMVPHIVQAPYILRPANFPPGNPGRGWRVYTAAERRIGVISLLGQSGFDRVHLSNPFTFLPEIISRLKEDTNTIVLDFHALTTAEKYTMLYHAAGTLSAIIGTGTRVPTSDATVRDGTAYITDIGRTGSIDSVAGLDPKIEIQKHVSQIPERSEEAWVNLQIQGVLVETDDSTGKAGSIELVRHECKEPSGDGNGASSKNQR